MKNWIWIGLLLLTGAVGCIPIEDKINPEVGLLGLAPTYYYLDTIRVSAIFTDNNELSKARLSIKPYFSEVGEGQPWVFRDSADLQGRRIEPDWAIVVPAYRRTGTYLLTLEGIDGGGNPDTLQRLFELRADIQKPLFHQLETGLRALPNQTFGACRGETVPISGGVGDNLKLSKIGFAWGDASPSFLAVSTDSLSLQQVFSDKITVPGNLTDGQRIALKIVAVDTFGNTKEQLFMVEADCDDQLPYIWGETSQPSLNANRRVFLPEGGQVAFSVVYLWDNRYLQSAAVYFQKQGSPLQLVDQAELGTPDTVNLATRLPLLFALPAAASAGEIYEIRFQATDSAGNTRLSAPIELVVFADLPPVIQITDTYVNNIAIPFSRTGSQPLAVSRGSSLTFAGKIEDQIGIRQVDFYWIGNGLPPVLVKSYPNLNTRLVNIASLINASTFLVPNNAPSGSGLQLSTVATDSKGQQTALNFYFKVQ